MINKGAQDLKELVNRLILQRVKTLQSPTFFLSLKEILGYIIKKKRRGMGLRVTKLTKTSEDIFQVILGNIQQITGLFVRSI